MVGEIVAVGENVKDKHIGQFVGVGCMVGANCTDEHGARTCTSCTVDKDERYCAKGNIGTYGSPDETNGEQHSTWGGYSTDIVVDSHFACPVPDFFKGENLKYASPILCAGITVYTPLKRAGVTKGSKVGINGIGGLGMYGIQIALALGADVYAFTRSQSKVEDLMKLGCKEVILTTEDDQVAKHRKTFDFILDTVSADHNVNQLLDCIKYKGSFGLVGASPTPLPISTFSLIMGDINFFGSLIGTIQDTIEVLQLCAEHKICVPVEVIKPDEINEAYARMLKSDVKYRFSIDIEAMRNPQ